MYSVPWEYPLAADAVMFAVMVIVTHGVVNVKVGVPEKVSAVHPLVPPGGVAQVASSLRKRLVPAVAPGSGTAPCPWVEGPDAPKTG